MTIEAQAPTTPVPRAPGSVFLRPIGSPIALGLAGLTLASLVASGLELGWVAQGERHVAALAFLGFAFPLQFAASLLAFQARDGAVGTAMGVLAGTWLLTGLTFVSTRPGSSSGALGLALLAAGGLLFAAAAGAALGKWFPATVFTVEALRFLLIGIHELGGTKTWQHAGGVVGLVVVALAGYGVLAAVLEDARGATVLPLGRHGLGANALRAGFEAQLDGVENEAGVRNQL
jgi:uncharacterized protein